MPTIQYVNNLIHQSTGIVAGVSGSYIAAELPFTVIIESLTNTPTSVDYGSVITPKHVLLWLEEGDDVEVSVDAGATYAFRLSGADDFMDLRLNVEDYRETATITATADASGSLSGTYFDINDRAGAVRVWFLTPSRAEVSQIVATADVAGSLDGTGFVLNDAAGSVGVWFDHGDSGTLPPVEVTGADRQIEINSLNNDDTAIAVAFSIQQALDADAAFSAATDGVDTVTITDAAVGARTDILDSTTAATGFTFSVTSQGVALASAPSTPVGGRLLEVDISIDDTALVVATALTAVVDADAEFLAVSDGVDTVTITDQHVGVRTNMVAGTTGWTVATTQEGAAAPSVMFRAVDAAGTAEVVATVSPL